MKSKINKLFGKRQWWIGLCLCFCFLAGCEDAEMTPDPPVPGVNGMLPFDLGSAVSSGSKVRVILFSAPTESGNRSFRYNKLFTGLSGFNVPLYPGEYNDVYTVIDEETDLSSVADWASFAAVKISRSLPSDVNAVKQRYYEYKNIHALNDGSGKMLYNGTDISKTGLRSSVYTVARVFLSFDLDPVLSGITLRFREAELSNVPGFGYLYPKAYDGTDYGKKTIPLGASTVTGGRYKFETQFLVPEYLLAAGSTRRMTLTVRADRYRGNVKEGSSEYTVNVGNDIAGGTSQNIDRNKVYTFKFTGVTGLGQQVDDWRVTAAVDDWDQRTVDSEIGDAYGFFLQTERIDDFKAFRMPRYVNFKAMGPGTVWVDKPREIDKEDTIAWNDFRCKVLWDDDAHRSGRLSLVLGNWRTGGGFSTRIKLRANNIEKTLVINCAGARYATGFLQSNLTWAEGMGYTAEANSGYSEKMPEEDIIRLYSQGDEYRGCAGYYEGSPADPLTGKGCWRMATMREGLYYLREKNIKSQIWAYELGWPAKSYTANTKGSFPAGDLHHPNNMYIPMKNRAEPLSVLCVQDDKLEKYYHVEVNRADYSGDVTFAEAQQICQSLTEGGKSGWRLPTLAESGYALVNAGRQGIPNNFDASLYWLSTGEAAGPAHPGGTTPPGNVANVRCVRNRW